MKEYIKNLPDEGSLSVVRSKKDKHRFREVKKVEDFKVGDLVFSELSGSGRVIEHPHPDIQPRNKVYVEFADGRKLNCNPDNLSHLAKTIGLDSISGEADA